jgi:hypothetical protein
VRHLVDADYLIDATGDVPEALQTLERLSEDGLALSAVAVAELYEGSYRFPDPEAMLAAFRAFLADATPCCLSPNPLRRPSPASMASASTSRTIPADLARAIATPRSLVVPGAATQERLKVRTTFADGDS